MATNTPRTQAVLNIYRELRRDDKTLTQRKFATDYLNRCPAYIPSTRNQGREFSDKAIVCLVRQLRAISQAWQEISESDPRPRAQSNYQRMSTLAEQAQKLLLE